jgi:hypothetical protein
MALRRGGKSPGRHAFVPGALLAVGVLVVVHL